MILVIDNYDSFVYNLVQYLGELGQRLAVYRNDKITLSEVRRKKIEALVISPGPGRPENAGVSNELIQHCSQYLPILGVCLGHQCIGEVFGAKIVHAKRLMHGKTSLIYHYGKDIYRAVENPFTATRYHSLIIKEDSLPECLIRCAWTQEGEIMGIRHKDLPVFGVQFHPESILTKVGKQVLRNFLEEIRGGGK
ncbi:aminodeoxychorismate/anthranilate synthase component II [Candidatus Aerophobetes bacterium]|uniref:Aminodeoxychorismate/anthranilate synthase component II n=1 Tax=Aerophobetes bacterium TaxID=2030807 RepID=A0A523VXZ4_UNCAE|nr:MAG: aminodeoxychorismate/anthranilate synthase component II [Candidatus Aerophobetes bacterium]